MNKDSSNRYREAGVDLDEGYRAVELIKRHVARTNIPGVCEDIGGFGGLFAPNFAGMTDPLLVSGTDGVGTKLKLAFALDRHDTIGIDCVAMCTNDIICSGAKPLFFLDYIALGKSVAERVAEIVSGIAEGCIQSGCALIGGETAEMPGFYREGEYDLAGFAVGIVDRPNVIDRSQVQAGDLIIGLPSAGVHSNGFSLVRNVFNLERTDLNSPIKELQGRSLGDVLLEPTRIYVRPVLALLEEVRVRSIAHITGGGFFENVPRSLPAGLSAVIELDTFDVLPIFQLIQRKGEIPTRDMFNVFNMGIGMTVIVSETDAARTLEILSGEGVDARVIGTVVEGSEGVTLC